MGAMGQLMGSFAQQFGASVQVDKLAGTLPKALLTAALAVSTAVATTEAKAQQYQQVLPQQSGVYWGQMLGQVLGASVGAVAAKEVGSPGVAQVVMGVSQEIGRNLGGMAAQEAYSAAKAAPGGAILPGAMPLQTRDHLDTYGLRAAFAFEEYARLYEMSRRGERVSQSMLDQAHAQFVQARDRLAYEARSVRASGIAVDPWLQLHNELAQTTVSISRVADLARPMAERLNRPGGPGYRDPSMSASGGNRLSELRQRVESRSVQQDVVYRQVY